MEIGRWHCYFIINCVIIAYVLAKPFSINDALAAESKLAKRNKTVSAVKGTDLLKKPFSTKDALTAESKQAQGNKTASTPKRATSEKLLFNKGFLHEALKTRRIKTLKQRLSESPLSFKYSPLKYRKFFKIKSPVGLRPKKFNYLLTPRLQRQKQSTKREIKRQAKLKKRYVPLLKSFGLLFDNLLSSEHDSSEYRTRKRTRLRSKGSTNRQSNGKSDDICKCSPRSDAKTAESVQVQKAVAAPTATITPKIAVTQASTVETTAPTTNHTTDIHISNIGRHTDLSAVLTGDTDSVGRNDTGYSEASGSALHSGAERNIPGHNRVREHHTTDGWIETSTGADAEDTDDDTRDGARGPGPAGDQRNGTHSGTTEEARTEVSEAAPSEETENTIRRYRGNLSDIERENKLEAGGDEAKSPVFIPQFVRGTRGLVSHDKVSDHTEPIQPKEDCTESRDSLAGSGSSNKQVTDRDGTITAENKKASATNETVITIKDLSNPIFVFQSGPKDKNHRVTIIDGYSVARDKYGHNKYG